MFVDDTYKGHSICDPALLFHLNDPQHMPSIYTDPQPSMHVPCTHTPSQTCIYHVHIPQTKHAYTMYTDPQPSIHIPCTHTPSQTYITMYTDPQPNMHILCTQTRGTRTHMYIYPKHTWTHHIHELSTKHIYHVHRYPHIYVYSVH